MSWTRVRADDRIIPTRGYRLRLLSAAFRNHMHWSEFIGGDVVISPPYKWQLRYNASDVEVKDRIADPVDPKIVAELSKKFGEFRRAYEPDGMTIGEFDGFGPTVRTIRQFAAGCHELSGLIRSRGRLPGTNTGGAIPVRSAATASLISRRIRMGISGFPQTVED